MPPFKPNPLGILKASDLAWQYYGFPVRSILAYDAVATAPDTPIVLYGPDPRRIKVEISLQNTGLTADLISLGENQDMVDNFAGLNISLNPGVQLLIVRTFLTDLDNLTSALWLNSLANSWQVGARETLLVPVPVDIVPENV